MPHLPVFNVNFFAIIAAAGAADILGRFWYSASENGPAAPAPRPGTPALAGSSWSYTGGMATAFVIAWTLAILAYAIGVTTIPAGAFLGGLCWLGFMATSSFERAFWGHDPGRKIAFQAGYQLVAAMLMGAIVAVWR